LQVLIFAVIFRLAISFLRDSKDGTIKEAVMAVYRFCYGRVRTMFTITKWVLEYTPIGIFALIATLFAQQGPSIFGSAAMLILVCYIGYAVQLFVI